MTFHRLSLKSETFKKLQLSEPIDVPSGCGYSTVLVKIQDDWLFVRVTFAVEGPRGPTKLDTGLNETKVFVLTLRRDIVTTLELAYRIYPLAA